MATTKRVEAASAAMVAATATRSSLRQLLAAQAQVRRPLQSTPHCVIADDVREWRRSGRRRRLCAASSGVAGAQQLASMLATPRVPELSSSAATMFVSVLEDFVAQGPLEMSVAMGEVLEIQYRDTGDGWTGVRRFQPRTHDVAHGENAGYIPTSYCFFLPLDDADGMVRRVDGDEVDAGGGGGHRARGNDGDGADASSIAAQALPHSDATAARHVGPALAAGDDSAAARRQSAAADARRRTGVLCSDTYGDVSITELRDLIDTVIFFVVKIVFICFISIWERETSFYTSST
jgi:hypothetical protein